MSFFYPEALVSGRAHIHFKEKKNHPYYPKGTGVLGVHIVSSDAARVLEM